MLVLTVLATLVKYTTDETEVRILYEYLAEASVVFPKVTWSVWSIGNFFRFLFSSLQGVPSHPLPA